MGHTRRGPENLGASFFEPSLTPAGYYMLGFYAHPNNMLLSGWVFAARDDSSDGPLLQQPLDYTLVWSSESLKIKQDGIGYIWLPVAPQGYKAVAYSPWIYFHPKETYLPSSVTWFFVNGALLYTKGEESNPVPIEQTGSNLPQGGSNDGNYWLDLPVDEAGKERVKKGDLKDSQVYLHVKPMLGATYSDIVIWVFHPFNGPAKAKVKHVGDWEHVTLRVSNFNGELHRVYFSKHSGGSWVDASDLEFHGGENKPCAYSSLHGHAMYSKPGMVLQGSGGIGIRNDTAKNMIVMDTGLRFLLVAEISYDLEDEVKKVEKILPGKLNAAFEKFINGLPNEVLGEEGPTGPKVKRNWNGDEV
ncbi:hypothetical protein F3Y22_tig00005974pilonHSYRG00201 [Hibiscus syriacus]|uniref:Uncharacterized protein n=1 Tax=Hibiscus syriacus TaxID=106335 RepID=A0A6A3CDK9_HIBSY|nr:hypothetical protein F3Y22_tig00005974pilonHSYRG00201 [Hibiscus syriacus]